MWLHDDNIGKNDKSCWKENFIEFWFSNEMEIIKHPAYLMMKNVSKRTQLKPSNNINKRTSFGYLLIKVSNLKDE